MSSVTNNRHERIRGELQFLRSTKFTLKSVNDENSPYATVVDKQDAIMTQYPRLTYTHRHIALSQIKRSKNRQCNDDKVKD